MNQNLLLKLYYFLLIPILNKVLYQDLYIHYLMFLMYNVKGHYLINL